MTMNTIEAPRCCARVALIERRRANMVLASPSGSAVDLKNNRTRHRLLGLWHVLVVVVDSRLYALAVRASGREWRGVACNGRVESLGLHQMCRGGPELRIEIRGLGLAAGTDREGCSCDHVVRHRLHIRVSCTCLLSGCGGGSVWSGARCRRCVRRTALHATAQIEVHV